MERFGKCSPRARMANVLEHELSMCGLSLPPRPLWASICLDYMHSNHIDTQRCTYTSHRRHASAEPADGLVRHEDLLRSSWSHLGVGWDLLKGSGCHCKVSHVPSEVGNGCHWWRKPRDRPASVSGTHWTPSIRLRVPLGSRKSENAKGTNNNTRMFSRNGSCGSKNIIQESKTSNNKSYPLVN